MILPPSISRGLDIVTLLHSSWCTQSPPGFEGGRFHQDGSGPYQFRRLATPTPLVQLRIGYFLTDQSLPNQGDMVMIPGSHNAAEPLPPGTPLA